MEKLAQNEHPKTPVIHRQSSYREISEKAGVDHEVVTAEIRKYVAEHPEAKDWPKEVLFGLAVTVHRLGLSLAPALGQAYLVRLRNEVQLIIGYRGMLKLAHRSGKVRSVDAQVVRESDDFKIAIKGESYDIEWSTIVGGLSDPGRIVGAFARVFLKDAPTIIAVLRMDAILELREKKSDIWQKDPEAMVKKTVLARALRMVPGLDEIQAGLEEDLEATA